MYNFQDTKNVIQNYVFAIAWKPNNQTSNKL